MSDGFSSWYNLHCLSVEKERKHLGVFSIVQAKGAAGGLDGAGGGGGRDGGWKGLGKWE